MSEDYLIELAEAAGRYLEPWKRPRESEAVCRPPFRYHYAGGFRIGRRQKAQLLPHLPKTRTEYSRGAHP